MVAFRAKLGGVECCLHSRFQWDGKVEVIEGRDVRFRSGIAFGRAADRRLHDTHTPAHLTNSSGPTTQDEKRMPRCVLWGDTLHSVAVPKQTYSDRQREREAIDSSA